MSTNTETYVRMLAEERITVQLSATAKTASFDVLKRVLTRPIRVISSDEVADLFDLHEIGHALWTPAEGWHTSIVDLGIPRRILNILEDVRIERLVKQRYPGSRRSFFIGYSKLAEDNFFGPVSGWKKYDLIDRINVQAKTGFVLCESPEDAAWMERAEQTESFDDVVELAKELHAFLKEKNANKVPQMPQMPRGDNGADESQDGADESQDGDDNGADESQDGADGDADGSQDGADGDADGSQDGADNGADGSQDGADNGADNGADGSQDGDEDGEETSTSYSSKYEESLLDDGAAQTGVINAQMLDGNKPVYNFVDVRDCSAQVESILSRAKLLADTHNLDWPKLKGINSYLLGKDYIGVEKSWRCASLQGRYAEWASMRRDNIGRILDRYSAQRSMFEQFKSAERSKYEQPYKSGRLDASKLWMNSINDNVFLTKTMSKAEQGHNIVLLLDFSISMKPAIDNMIIDALATVKLGMEFGFSVEIYAYTSNPNHGWKLYKNPDTKFENLKLMHLAGTSLPYEVSENVCLFWLTGEREALRETVCLFHDHKEVLRNPLAMHMTPTGIALAAMPFFLNKHFKNGDVNSFILYTDGDSAPYVAGSDGDISSQKVYYNGELIEYDLAKTTISAAAIKVGLHVLQKQVPFAFKTILMAEAPGNNISSITYKHCGLLSLVENKPTGAIATFNLQENTLLVVGSIAQPPSGTDLGSKSSFKDNFGLSATPKNDAAVREILTGRIRIVRQTLNAIMIREAVSR